MPSTTWLLAVAMWPALVASHAVRNVGLANDMGDDTTPVAASALLAKRNGVVALSFVQRWAAIGDSFTAGIGSGNRLGGLGSADWRCSRYSYTWPKIVDNVTGRRRESFFYTACSGDRSEGIYQQAQELDGDLDLVMMTAGGNDLPPWPEEVQFVVQLSDDAFAFDVKTCKESMDSIINSCDGNDAANPMNWKFGGKYVRGAYTFEINPKKDRQLLTRPDGSCQGWYKALFSSYTIYGRGWAGWDWGQETLLPMASSCVGGGVTAWEFEYYDEPQHHNGWEWRAFFRTPIWANARCFNNLRVQAAAGGYTHKWKEDASEEKYEDYGCTGSG